ncbi:MAG: hypothetical protein QOI18_836 [Solirubrobacteraceae bacterium]|jgi:hypothetical protein|nr:hypothetical protein [Solirubrobacteraceae bacterium]MEA2333795.1 hypothetical protein [Solirubrobacteraceae bacterium]
MDSLNGNSSSAQPPGAGDEQPTAVVVPVGGLANAQPALNGSMAELRRRRYELAERVAELTWDLGGLTYEMAIRDHYRLDVLARRASELQQADAQLAEIQRMLATAEAGVHGQCRSCGAVHSRGASFCWHCGAGLLEEARPSVLEASDQTP